MIQSSVVTQPRVGANPGAPLVRHHARVPGKDTNIGAKRAREARAALGLGTAEPVPCILTTLERDAAVPVALAALPAQIAGCVWSGAGRALVWANGAQPPARVRFTLAHELGHLRCGHDAHLAIDSFETLSGVTSDAREVQANAFAAELLMPAAGVRALVDSGEPTLETVVLLAAHFGVSTIAALYRLNTLGLAARYARLKEEIDGGLHVEVWERLDPPRPDDALERLRAEDLPRLSPAIAGSALAALLDGAASADEVAALIGCEAGLVARAAGLVGA